MPREIKVNSYPTYQIVRMKMMMTVIPRVAPRSTRRAVSSSTSVLQLVLVVLQKKTDKRPFYRVRQHPAVQHSLSAIGKRFEGLRGSRASSTRDTVFLFSKQFSVPGCRTRRRWRGRDRRSSLGVAASSCSPLCNGQNLRFETTHPASRLSLVSHPIVPF